MTSHSGSNFSTVLKSYVSRIEQCERELTRVNATKRDIYRLARREDIDVPALKKVVAERRKDPEKRRSEDRIFHEYWLAVHENSSAFQSHADRASPAEESEASGSLQDGWPVGVERGRSAFAGHVDLPRPENRQAWNEQRVMNALKAKLQPAAFEAWLMGYMAGEEEATALYDETLGGL